MGGVCCKDGVDKQEQGGGNLWGPAEVTSAPTPALGKAALEVPGATEPAKELTQQAQLQGSGKEEAPPASTATPALEPASNAAATAVNADQITLSERAQQAAPGDNSIEVPQTSAVRVGDNVAATTSPAPAPAAPTPATTAVATPAAAESTKPQTPVEPMAQATQHRVLQPQPRPAAGEEMTEPPTQQQPLPPFKPQVWANLVQASEPSPRVSAPNLEVPDFAAARDTATTSGLPSEPPTRLAEAGLSIARDPSTTDQTAAPRDGKVRVETTRRSTHPPIAGGGAGGEASSSVSYSHSATSSQPPGSSAPQGSSHNPQDGGSAMIGSSAPPAWSAAGEPAAATTTGGNSLVGAECNERAGSSNAMSDPSGTGSTPATNKTANSGFMFGAPRARDHQEKRRKGGVKRGKSHSSGSNASGAQPPPGSGGISGSKASGSDAPGAAASGNRGAVSGSQAATMMGSSAADPSVGSMDMMAASTPAFGGRTAGSSSIGIAPGSPAGDGGGSIGPRDYTTIGRRISKPADLRKPAAASGGGGASTRPSSKTRSVPSSATTGSSADGVAAAAGGLGLKADGEGGGAAAGPGGVPEAVPEGEVEGEGEDVEGEEEDDEEEAEDSGGSRRSSSEHLSIMSPPEGSDVENVLMLICNIFQLPVALVAAYRSANIFIRSTAMRLTDDDQWRYSLAQWSMLNAYELRDVLLVPNAALDDRFRNHYCVKNEPKLKFFMASPLRSSTGELLGTLCMADFTERTMEPANLLVVNNLQTLVIRQLERDMALAAERAENELATERLQQEMMRALDHFEKCIMFVDTSKPGWEVLYTNMAWEHVTGIPREHVLGRALPDGSAVDPSRVPRVHVQGRPLQDFFMALGGAALDWSSTAEEVASRAEFTVHRVAVRQKPDKLVSLHLRLATDEANGELEGLLPKGLPGWVKARGNEAHNYFVFVEEVNPQAPGSSTVYEALAKHVEKVPGLELSHLLGKGGFGSVYYGTWNGMPVAVKMIDNKLTKTNTEGVSLEALMGQELSHPNIVKTIKYVMRNAFNASSMSGSNSRGGMNSKPPLHSRNGPYSGGIITSRHGSRGLMLPAAGSSGANAAGGGGNGHGGVGHGANGHGGVGGGGGPATGMMSYMTSAQPGLSGMTSAQMAAALDLTSASAMQHFHRTGTTMTSDATTVAGGGSQYSGNPCGAVGNGAVDGSMGVPPREASLAAVAAAAASGARASAGPGTATTSTTSGQTALGPASIAASSASTAAGPPSLPSAGGIAANLTGLASPAFSSRGPSVTAGSEHFSARRGSGALTLAAGAAGAGFDSRGQPRTPRTPAAAAAVALPAQMPPLAAPAGGAASITAAYPPDAPPPNLSHLTPGQQQAAMTSRFSLAFSTITSGGEVLVPGKGSRSPSSSSGGVGHTQQMAGPMGSAGSGEDMGEVWIIMEFCDRGSLQDALDRGALKLRKPGGEAGETHLPMMVATACEVASALQYLHERGIVHGDLTAWNVMLCTSPGGQQDRSGRNFVAKVADFGLSRTLDVRSKIKTRTYGTISHMPPECLISGIISKATDVFAFGVLLWQMYTGLRPWAGMNHGQIIYNVGMKNVQLLFPPGTPPAIADLSSSCTRTEPTHRPSFNEILDKLDNIRASLGL